MSEAPKKFTRKLPVSRLQQAEFKRTIWRATADAGTKREDMLQEEFWSHVGGTMQPYDRIEVIPEEGGWYAEYIVVKCGPRFAKVRELMFVDLDGAAMSPDKDITNSFNDDYSLEYKGAKGKWTAFRKSDNEKILEGYASKAELHEALRVHLKQAA